MNATGVDRRQPLLDPTVSAGTPAVVGSGLVTAVTVTGSP